MDETHRRRLSIAREPATWGVAMPALLARIAAALEMPRVPGRHKLDFEVLARRIAATFKAIGEAADSETSDEVNYEQLIERTDRLRELIAAANAALDGLVKQ
jgi:hypothetical protein